MGGPSAKHEEPSDVFEGIDDPWGSGDEADTTGDGAGAAKAAVAAGAAAPPEVAELQPAEAELQSRVRRTEDLVLERWAIAREKGDEFLQYSSMITCMPLQRSATRSALPRGYSATWGLEVLREGERWRVLAAGRGFQAGEVVERCPLMPLERPEDDDAAICRYMCLWNEEAIWTKEHAKKLPDMRAQKLAEMQLTNTEILRLHRVVRFGGPVMHYPLGYAHLYADAAKGPGASPPAAELRADAAAKEAVVVALREISPGEEITLAKKPPVKSPVAAAPPQPGAEAAPAPAAAASSSGSAPCSGYVTARPSGLHGSGAFAAAGYAAGRAVELCPALLLDGPAALHCADYCMSFGGNCGKSSVLPLGCGALYNHAAGPDSSPLAWAYDEELELIVLRADAPVAAGSELFIDYGTGYWGSRGLEPAH